MVLFFSVTRGASNAGLGRLAKKVISLPPLRCLPFPPPPTPPGGGPGEVVKACANCGDASYKVPATEVHEWHGYCRGIVAKRR